MKAWMAGTSQDKPGHDVRTTARESPRYDDHRVKYLESIGLSPKPHLEILPWSLEILPEKLGNPSGKFGNPSVWLGFPSGCPSRRMGAGKRWLHRTF
jgi:hypothetical protein